MEVDILATAKRALELDKEATPGPWRYESLENVRDRNIVGRDGYTIIERDSGVYGPEMWDAEFILFTRTALPELASEVIRLTEILRQRADRNNTEEKLAIAVEALRFYATPKSAKDVIGGAAARAALAKLEDK